MSLQYLKKEVRDELGFLHADKHQTDILKALKVTSLQYLYSISKKKKKLGMGFIFCMQINIKVSTSWHYHFSWKWPDMSKVPKIGIW